MQVSGPLVTTQQFDSVLKNGRIVDPTNNIDGAFDLGIRHGKVAAVAENIALELADDIIDVTGQIVMPGHIDTHAHLSSPFNRSVDRAYGHAMLVESGTTTALDLAGDPTAMANGMLRRGAGLNVASLMGLVPHSTIKEDDPGPSVIRDVIADVKKRGGIGVKLLGGYHPFTPEVSADVVKEANDQLAWVAFHVGTKDSGSDMTGLREVPEITGAGRLHVAHINSYTRGMVDEPHEEVQEALRMIERMRSQWVTEAYLAQANGTNGLCDEAGNLVYNVAQNCLKARGYPTTDKGIRAALLDGYGSALVERGGRGVGGGVYRRIAQLPGEPAHQRIHPRNGQVRRWVVPRRCDIYRRRVVASERGDRADDGACRVRRTEHGRSRYQVELHTFAHAWTT